MALFGFSKEKKDEGPSDQVLAYLEDVQRVRTPFSLCGDRGREVAAHLIGLSAENGLATFQLQGPLPGDKGARIVAAFVLDGLRIGGTFLVVSSRTGQADLALPGELQILERRAKPRAKLNPREGATLTALTGIFEGMGMTGIIENISETGARIRVERALEIKGERKQSLHTSLIQPGHAFGILRLSKLPRMSGAWECSGRSVYLEGGSAALYLGVAFSGFPGEAQNALRSLISSRIGAIPSSLPPKTRRNPEPDLVAEPAPSPRPSPPKPAPEAAGPAEEPAPDLEPRGGAAQEPIAPARNAALLKLKKRSRSVAVILTPGNAHGPLLVDHLSEEGYAKVQVARTLRELLEMLSDAPPNLLFIDDGVAELQGVELVDALHRLHDELPPIVLAQAEISAATVLAARRAGVASLMVKPYDLDEAFSAILEAALGL